MVCAVVLGLFTTSACGDPVDDDATAGSATQSETEPTSATDPTTEGEAASDTDVQPTSCNGGPACGAGEFCTTGDEDCDCDSQFQHCELVRTDPGCYAIPADCVGLTGDAQLECIATQSCTLLDVDSGWIDGVLHCGRYEECAGDCDFDPDSCVDTSTGPSETSSSESGSSESGSSDSGSSDGGDPTSGSTSA